MDSLSSPVEMFFFPFVGGGHQIPMIDMARMFAAHGAKSTIVATPNHALYFQESILRDQQSGRRIFIETLALLDNTDLSNTDMTASALTDTSMLQEPLTKLLLRRRPDCIVHDMFHHWAVGAIDNLELDIARIVFNGNGCFASCIRYNVTKFRPHETVDSKYEPFVVPDLPDRIELTPSQLPAPAFQFVEENMLKATDNCYGVAVNSFYELEPAYVEQSKKGYKAWIVGPVSLYNRSIADKTEHGKKAAIDEQSILSWLHSKQPNSVLYISFGSVGRLAPEQIVEIAYGLQASNQPFIWVVGNVFKGEGTWFPSGFEEKMKESEQGLIINGWAPQLLILEHGSIGGFVTHCGWNSVLEGLSCGVPMITWPMFADQFYNEKLVTDVLKVGVKVGSLDWLTWNMEGQRTVGRDKVEAAVKRLMGGGEESVEMRNNARVVGEMAKKAVGEGGSSYKDAIGLINELEDRRKRTRSDV